mmetsp:Transcript_75774/g.181163  ORF Transcript_75774/g.181163 Transcript_75774/m.181163 type:complete len:411 (-) Transcript_75774:1752-2984(-)
MMCCLWQSFIETLRSKLRWGRSDCMDFLRQPENIALLFEKPRLAFDGLFRPHGRSNDLLLSSATVGPTCALFVTSARRLSCSLHCLQDLVDAHLKADHVLGHGVLDLGDFRIQSAGDVRLVVFQRRQLLAQGFAHLCQALLRALTLLLRQCHRKGGQFLANALGHLALILASASVRRVGAFEAHGALLQLCDHVRDGVLKGAAAGVAFAQEGLLHLVHLLQDHIANLHLHVRRGIAHDLGAREALKRFGAGVHGLLGLSQQVQDHHVLAADIGHALFLCTRRLLCGVNHGIALLREGGQVPAEGLEHLLRAYSLRARNRVASLCDLLAQAGLHLHQTARGKLVARIHLLCQAGLRLRHSLEYGMRLMSLLEEILLRGVELLKHNGGRCVDRVQEGSLCVVAGAVDVLNEA